MKQAEGNTNKRGKWRRILNAVLMGVSIILLTGLLISAYSGYISPSRFPWAGIAAMSFPFWLAADIIWIVITVIIAWRCAIPCLAAIVLSSGTVLDYCPLHFLRNESGEEAGKKTFTLLTYNVYQYADKDSIYQEESNVTLSYILSSGADIVALQESSIPVYPNKRFHITASQTDSVKAIYPYRAAVHSTTVLSKFPFKEVDLVRDTVLNESVIVCDFEIYGAKIRLYNMHLASFKLTDTDKELYREITNLDARGKKEEVKQMILPKLINANRCRAFQARALCKIIKETPVDNTIICGDFNDVPNCYTIRKLEKLGFRQVYSEVGFGPLITYYRDRLFFRIDHILYKGNITPLTLKREKVRTSDHYPQLVRFSVD